MSTLSQGYVWGMSGVCREYVGSMSGICREYVGHMSGVCREHVGSMSEIFFGCFHIILDLFFTLGFSKVIFEINMGLSSCFLQDSV